jgi:hypothetical protein
MNTENFEANFRLWVGLSLQIDAGAHWHEWDEYTKFDPDHGSYAEAIDDAIKQDSYIEMPIRAFKELLRKYEEQRKP